MDRLGAMEVFVRVVESGSFSAAAKQVRVGQPAVSKTISQRSASTSTASCGTAEAAGAPMPCPPLTP
jgi:hypothetical protein